MKYLHQIIPEKLLPKDAGLQGLKYLSSALIPHPAVQLKGVGISLRNAKLVCHLNQLVQRL